ncbi:MAG: permease-like cell division protein FtsX [Lentimicrobiaceae bacterium]|nr:permease-like cell division protein FtsX [Lentimicrobiaceae bacterium]
MAEQIDKITKHRLTTSRITTVISISLVLFIIGILGIVIINVQTIADNVRENIGFEIMLSSDMSEGELSKMEKNLSLKPYVKSLKYNSKEENVKETAEELGLDFGELELVGSIIPESFQIKIKSEYTSLDSLLQIEKAVYLMPHVSDIVYDKTYVEKINENLYKIGFILLSISGILLIISVALISNTIRLSIYARRFIIRSMLLVGAKRRTVYAPFILTGIIQGIWGAVIAVLLLLALLYGAYTNAFFSEVVDLSHYQLYLGLIGIILLLGVLITWLSTLFSVRRYIKMKTDKLYF